MVQRKSSQNVQMHRQSLDTGRPRRGKASRLPFLIAGGLLTLVAAALIATALALPSGSDGVDDPASSASAPPTSGADFVADAETGDTDQWCYVHSAIPVGVVTSPVRAGRYAFKSEIRDGPLIYDTERSEYANGPGSCDKPMFRAGTETWTAVSVYLDAGFPEYSSWSLIAQWKEADGGSPPSQISVENEQLAILGADSLDPRPRFPFGTIERGRWIDFLVHHKWSTDQGIGFVEVIMDGELVLPKTFTRTMDNSNPLFLNVGQYRDLANSGTAVLYIDEVRVGPTRQSVAP
ncbi:MAG: heparin lyase I family protein [Chloroflexi bacterium]|nr:heparin lyase I family protein [Chloroflexota bacterium]